MRIRRDRVNKRLVTIVCDGERLDKLCAACHCVLNLIVAEVDSRNTDNLTLDRCCQVANRCGYCYVICIYTLCCCWQCYDEVLRHACRKLNRNCSRNADNIVACNNLSDFEAVLTCILNGYRKLGNRCAEHLAKVNVVALKNCCRLQACTCNLGVEANV